MRTRIKDRIMDWVIILAFALIIGGSAYFIYRVMIHWKVKGLG